MNLNNLRTRVDRLDRTLRRGEEGNPGWDMLGITLCALEEERKRFPPRGRGRFSWAILDYARDFLPPKERERVERAVAARRVEAIQGAKAHPLGQGIIEARAKLGLPPLIDDEWRALEDNSHNGAALCDESCRLADLVRQAEIAPANAPQPSYPDGALRDFRPST